MKILLVAATEKEILPILDQWKDEEYIVNGHQISILITGVGIASAAFHIGRIIAKERFDIAIQAGIAGAYDKNTAIGEVFHVLSDRFLYFGSEDQDFIPISKLDLQHDKDVYYASFNHMIPSLSALKKAEAITSNTIHTDDQSIEEIKEEYNPQLESMEGASFFFACREENIPCIQIRAISNYVSKRNKNNWNISLAVDNLCTTIHKIVYEL